MVGHILSHTNWAYNCIPNHLAVLVEQGLAQKFFDTLVPSGIIQYPKSLGSKHSWIGMMASCNIFSRCIHWSRCSSKLFSLGGSFFAGTLFQPAFFTSECIQGLTLCFALQISSKFCSCYLFCLLKCLVFANVCQFLELICFLHHHPVSCFFPMSPEQANSVTTC